MLKYLVVIFLLPMFCLSQGTFLRTYGGPNNDNGWYVFEDPSGNFVLCGDSGGTTKEVYFLVVDSSGNTIFNRTYGESTSNDIARCVKPTLDRGFILIGDKDNSIIGADQVARAIKTDSIGDTLWTQELFGGNGRRWGVSVLTLADSNYIIGSVNDDGGTYNPYQLIKIKANGSFGWTQYSDVIHSTYFGGYGSSMQTTDDGGFIIGGTNEINVQSQDVMSLTKTDSAGIIQWYKEYTGPQNCDGLSVCSCFDGGYIVAGYTDCYGAGGWDMYVLRTNSVGDSLWARTFGSSGDDVATAIQQTSDSGFVIFGYSRALGAFNNDIVLLRLNVNGDSLWQKVFGGVGDDVARHGFITRDGGFAMVGSTTSFGAGGYDVLFIKTDSLGLLTSLNELSKHHTSFNVYPNPVTSGFSVDAGSYRIVSIEVINVLGKLVYSQYSSPTSSSNIEINLDGFPSGVYTIRIRDIYGNPYNKTIVKL